MANADSSLINKCELSNICSIHHVFERSRDVIYENGALIFRGTEDDRMQLLNFAINGAQGISSGIKAIGHILAYSEQDEITGSLHDLGWLLTGLGEMSIQLLIEAGNLGCAKATEASHV